MPRTELAAPAQERTGSQLPASGTVAVALVANIGVAVTNVTAVLLTASTAMARRRCTRLVRKPETTQIAGMLVTFPLMFASSAYVPIASLPGWLQALAKLNPLSYTVDAARGYALGTPSSGALTKSVLIAAALACVSIVGATTAYRRIDH